MLLNSVSCDSATTAIDHTIRDSFRRFPIVALTRHPISSFLLRWRPMSTFSMHQADYTQLHARIHYETRNGCNMTSR